MAFSFYIEWMIYFKFLICFLPFLLTYLVTSLRVWLTVGSIQKGKRPPVSPYWVPIFGHVFAFLWDTANVDKLTRQTAYPPIPTRLRLFNTEITFVRGSENINTLWRSKVLQAREVTCFSLGTFFNTPKAAMKIYHQDDSGISLQPHPKSNIPFKDRYYFHTRKDLVGFFQGPRLKHMTQRFHDRLKDRISNLEVNHNWVEFADLYSFVQDILTGPAVEAMCGPVLLEQNPTFIDDFWQLDSDILIFFKSLPRWVSPRAWKNREKILTAVKTWQAYAQEHFDESCVEADGHDCFYGSPLIRLRQNYLPKVDGLDADACAAQDLGLLWAENANSIPAVFWLIFELLQRPHDFSLAQSEIAASQFKPASEPRSPSAAPAIDIDSICTKPLIQSAYAETLRLYTSLFTLRSPTHEDFHLGVWKLPQDKLIAVDSRVAHMGSRFWNTGSCSLGFPEHGESSHPLQKFWTARFLEYDDDPSSGPLRRRSAKSNKLGLTGSGKGPRFTMEGLTGAWLPFGGGPRQCPGRNFAKQEIIVGFAMIAASFEMELSEKHNLGRVAPDMRYYGLGTLPPKRKVPFRIRRKHQ